MSFDVTELDRRLANLIRFGTISAADYAHALVRVTCGDITTGWLPWLTPRAGGDLAWHAPEVGEQVLILSPSGELTQGVVLAGLYQTACPQPAETPERHLTHYLDGAVIEYDREHHHLSAVLPSGGSAALIAADGIAITGDITLTGTLTASVDVIAHGISLHNHKHGGVATGGGDTGVPK